MRKIALFSLHDTAKVREFARALIAAGWDIVASRETAGILSAAGLPVEDVADFTGVREDYGFPPTLHPKIESYLTGPTTREHIGLVYIIPYPASAGNDVGGRALLALAAKGNRIAVSCVADMEIVAGELAARGAISRALRADLADKANALVAGHFSELAKGRGRHDAVQGAFQYALRNGENPYQVPAALFAAPGDDPLALRSLRRVSGEAPCFTNLADSDSLLQVLCAACAAFRAGRGRQPYVCIAAKHGNPCGMAVDWDSPAAAIEKALWGDPRAIWGGEVAVNFALDEPLARLLFASQKRGEAYGQAAWMLDVVLAPALSAEALPVLGRRKARKLLVNPALASPAPTRAPWSYRFVRGGFLRQPPASYVLDLRRADYDGPALDDADGDSLIVAWAVAYGSNLGGNEIALAKDRCLLACAGGPATITAVETALARARALGRDVRAAFFAADAFFPFPDAPALLARSGLAGGAAPAGGKAFAEVKALFREQGLRVFYLPESCRGFCRH